MNSRNNIITTLYLNSGTRTVDFCGVWGLNDGLIIPEGIFTLFIGAKPKDAQNIDGVIIDGYGHAHITDLKISDEGIYFKKKYLDEVIKKDPNVSINQIEYKGSKLGNVYVGKYNVISNDELTNIIGPFFLVKYSKKSDEINRIL